MYFFDLGLVIKFWLVLFIIGILFLPITTKIFRGFFDKGYIFSKILGVIILSYTLFLFSTTYILPFNTLSILLIFIIYLVALLFSYGLKIPKLPEKKLRRIWVFEESVFLVCILFWCYVKGFQPDINGLEKFMDFGFINSAIRTEYFPAIDMWFAKEPINYYYFGHLITAFLTKLTGIESFITYNIMLSAIFAFCFAGSFSLVFSVAYDIFKKIRPSILAGLLSAFLVTFSGNLHTIYTFFEGYQGENPVPFWELKMLPLENYGTTYWYPNATRFIHNTIHEFPSYSFVVSDLHGHVLDIPIVLLTLAATYVLVRKKGLTILNVFLFSFLTAIMYMTNAWDGILYSGLIGIIIILKSSKLPRAVSKNNYSFQRFYPFFQSTFVKFLILGLGFFLFTLPFNVYFKPFASGIGFLCAPESLQGTSFGPFLFEGDHCQRSPFYQLAILWGFFYITMLTFVLFLVTKGKKLLDTKPVLFMLILFFFASLLILIPEFVYAKDIYPDHYRANTMFKLGYQAFIMLSLTSGLAITILIRSWKKIFLIPLFVVLIVLVMIYPYFAIQSYFGDITPDRYQGLNGISYLKFKYPEDYEAIMWLRENVSGQPVIAEAQGDSYTDYARVSANTGLPTILGWTVHEWLWRGDYSIPQPRIEDVKTLYEGNVSEGREIIERYHVSYIFIGNLERKKYQNINVAKFRELATPVFTNGTTTIYQVNL